MITVSPKDEFRYGYRLWIDETTAMPLKTQLCDGHGRVIEQIVFASLTLSSRIADSEFKPDVSTEGFQWLRNDSQPGKEPPENASLVWNALKLPPGFKMAARSAQVMPGSTDPVSHLVFSDGLASVSVFVEVETKTTTTRPRTARKSRRSPRAWAPRPSIRQSWADGKSRQSARFLRRPSGRSRPRFPRAAHQRCQPWVPKH